MEIGGVFFLFLSITMTAVGWSLILLFIPNMEAWHAEQVVLLLQPNNHNEWRHTSAVAGLASCSVEDLSPVASAVPAAAASEDSLTSPAVLLSSVSIGSSSVCNIRTAEMKSVQQSEYYTLGCIHMYLC